MDKIVLSAKKREIKGKKVSNLRRAGELPAVIYGKGVKEPISITLNLQDTTLLMRTVSSSSVVTLDVDGKEYNTLIRDRQRDVLKGTYIHLDFLAISMTETVSTFVNLYIIGVAPAVKAFEALIITGVGQIEVEALPQDLPESIEIDISNIESIGDGIYVKDITLPSGVTCLSSLEDMIVVASAPALVEEEPEEIDLDELEGDEEPEVIEKGKKEEGEEGEE